MGPKMSRRHETKFLYAFRERVALMTARNSARTAPRDVLEGSRYVPSSSPSSIFVFFHRASL